MRYVRLGLKVAGWLVFSSVEILGVAMGAIGSLAEQVGRRGAKGCTW